MHRSLISKIKDSLNEQVSGEFETNLVKSEDIDVQKKEYENSDAKNQEHNVKTIVEQAEEAKYEFKKRDDLNSSNKSDDEPFQEQGLNLRQEKEKQKRTRTCRQDYIKHAKHKVDEGSESADDDNGSESEQPAQKMMLRGAVSRAFGIHDLQGEDDLSDEGNRRGRKENGLVELTKKFINLLKEAPN